MTTCKPEEFADVVGDFLDEKLRIVSKAVDADVEAVGKECARQLKAVKDPKKRKHKGKHYHDGWTCDVKWQVEGSTATVYNKTKPQLTTLLEKGHGGPAPAPAHPHIEPTFEKVKGEWLRKIEQ